MLWDLYQHYQIEQLESRVERVQTAGAEDSATRRAALHLEERVDRLALLCRAMFELLQESTGHTEERLSAKILEIDLRDGQADGKMSPRPMRCPKCEAMMSPRFGVVRTLARWLLGVAAVSLGTGAAPATARAA